MSIHPEPHATEPPVQTEDAASRAAWRRIYVAVALSQVLVVLTLWALSQVAR